MWAAVALSFALAMDACAVSAARGLAGNHRRELIVLPLFFGGFQSGMSALGWQGGTWAARYLGAWNAWLACGLLTLIGVKMIWDARRHHEQADAPAPGTLAVYTGLAIATSIDAAAAGITLPALAVEPWLAIALIGGITAAGTAIAFALGSALGHRIGKHLGMAGGVVLIAIGIDMLIRAA